MSATKTPKASPADRIRSALKTRTATELAAAVGCCERTVYRVLTQNAWPRQPRVRNGFARALGLSERDLA